MTIYQGDSTTAFGNNLITIRIVNPYELEVSKAVFRCGHIIKEFENPVFPLMVNFDSDETRKLCMNNECYLAVWDSMGRKKTCKGTLTIKAKNEVVNG